MRRRRAMWLAGSGATLAVAAVVIAGGRATRARSEAAAAASAFEAAWAEDAEIAALRASLGAAPAADSSRDLLARVTAALDAAGVPRTALRDLKSGGGAPAPAARGTPAAAQRQTAHLTLSSLELPAVGAFLAAWRQEGGAWVVTAVQLEHAGPASSTAFNVRLTLTAPPAAPLPTGPNP